MTRFVCVVLLLVSLLPRFNAFYSHHKKISIKDAAFSPLKNGAPLLKRRKGELSLLTLHVDKGFSILEITGKVKNFSLSILWSNNCDIHVAH